MPAPPSQHALVRAGDEDGLGRVYSADGGLLTSAGETVIQSSEGWDLNASSPWRRVLPGIIFEGFNGEVSSRLYVTNERIVLVRDFDVLRELGGEFTPVGAPTATAEAIRRRRLKSLGVRAYCEIWPQTLKVVKEKFFAKPRSWLNLKLIGTDGVQYALLIWRWRKDPDDAMLNLLRTRFSR